jgi:hypothetical protein
MELFNKNCFGIILDIGGWEVNKLLHRLQDGKFLNFKI